MVNLRANTKIIQLIQKKAGEKKKNKNDKQKSNRYIVDIKPVILIIALNISGLSTEMKLNRL